MKREAMLALRDRLASIGSERTPDEVEAIVRDAERLYDAVDLDTYRHMRDLGPGGVWLEARRHNTPLTEFFRVRDLLLFVGERKFPDEPKRKDKSAL